MNVFDSDNQTVEAGLNNETDGSGEQPFRSSRISLPLPAASTARMIAFAAVAVALIIWATPPTALIAGVVFALCLGTPLPKHGHLLARRLLQICVVMLGFGMNLPTLLRVGWNGALFAALTIGTTLLLGYWLGRCLKLSRNTSALISAGTAICGGSAIAAVGSVLDVKEAEIAVAMGTVFLLNAFALYLFPLLGHALHLSQQQFGVWAGVAIHDISSVVGASSVYGNNALETATAIKLARTLWIVPVTLGIVLAISRREQAKMSGTTMATVVPGPKPKRLKVEIPWFIGLFLLASLARSYIPGVAGWSPHIAHISKAGLTLVLCLIGASLSPRTMRAVGWNAALQGILLWIFISVTSLLVIIHSHA